MLSHFLLITGLVKFFNESPEPESGFRLRISVRYGNPGTPNRPPRALATSILTVYRILSASLRNSVGCLQTSWLLWNYILDLLNREDHNLRGSYTVWSFFHNILFKMAVISLQLLCLRTAFWQQMLWMHKDCSVKLKRLQRPLSCNRCRNRSSRWTKCPYRHWFQ